MRDKNRCRIYLISSLHLIIYLLKWWGVKGFCYHLYLKCKCWNHFCDGNLFFDEKLEKFHQCSTTYHQKSQQKEKTRKKILSCRNDKVVIRKINILWGKATWNKNGKDVDQMSQIYFRIIIVKELMYKNMKNIKLSNYKWFLSKSWCFYSMIKWCKVIKN